MNKAADEATVPHASRAKSNDVAVRFNAVTKRFGEVVALHDVSLAIKRGEFMTLLGPSGCGKTTLLNLVAGFFSPDGGEILIDGERVNDVPTFKREIGMMFQNYALFPHMTVANNIAYGLKARRFRRQKAIAASATCWRWSSSPEWKIASRASCRAASSSASRWRARS